MTQQPPPKASALDGIAVEMALSIADRVDGLFSVETMTAREKALVVLARAYRGANERRPLLQSPEVKHERRIVGHVSGSHEQMDSCVCGQKWPCKLADRSPADLQKLIDAAIEWAHCPDAGSYRDGISVEDTCANLHEAVCAYIGKQIESPQFPSHWTVDEMWGRLGLAKHEIKA